MKQQTVIWTALPNGVEGSRLRLSVFVSPRLRTDEGGRTPRLSQFPDFVDWPARIAEAQFSVQFGNGAPVPATRVDPEAAADGAELWRAMLNEETYIKPYEFPDLGTRVIRSFPVRNVLTHLKQTYQATAVESPTVVPKLRPDQLDSQPVGRLLREVSPPAEQKAAVGGQIDSQLRGSRAKALFNPAVTDATSLRESTRAGAPAGANVLAANVPQVTTDFHQVQTFYQPVPPALQAAVVRQVIEVPEIDFHGILSSLGQYPQVLRMLGLVIDLEVPVDAAAQGRTTVSVTPTWSPAMATTNVTPNTRCIIEAGGFIAEPRADSDIADGMLKLNDSDRFEVGQVDVDGAAIKMLGVAEDLQRGEDEKEAALPSLRSAGIWVARANRAHQLVALMLPRAKLRDQAIRKLEDNQSADVEDLYAEDLTRGYRIDVLDEETGAWRSLCRRAGKYHFVNADQGVDKTLSIADEGWISSAATETTDDATDDLFLHESLFRWEGWSLCAPRPMGAVEQKGVPESTGNDFGLDTRFAATPGSLPRLRFGHTYRMRGRMVDLAGNSLPPDLADSAAASETVEYTRHEPVSAPILVPRRSFDDSPGETLERMVIRTYNDSPAKDDQPSDEKADRHVAPPKTSQVMAETHGKFDGPQGMMGDQGTYRLIIENDGSFEDAHDIDQLELPYLPDPIAHGASIRSMSIDIDPGPGDSVFKVPFDGDWPDVRPFRIRIVDPLVEGKEEPEFFPNRRVLRVPVPKAGIAEIWVSCYMDEPEVPKMGMYRWTVESVAAPAIREARLAPVELQQVRRQLYQPREMSKAASRVKLDTAQVRKIKVINTAVLKGIHWMVTPYRKVTLVHAVQQPLIVPQFANLRALKSIGATFATLDDRFPISGNSTLKLDILAKWEEPIDAIREPTWKMISGNAHVVELPVEYQDTEVRMGPGEPEARPEVRPEARLEARPEARLRLVGPRALPMRRSAPGSPAMLAPRIMSLRVLGPRHEFGDTKYRKVTYRAIAATRFREYFPFSDQDIDSGKVSITRESDEVTVDVLSSARPAAPKVRYVIPTFGWESEKTAGGVVSKRSGGGLRVYLERPWFSSGDGELLGVVLLSRAPRIAGRRTIALRGRSTTIPDSLKPYVTQTGADPIFRSGSMKSAPAPSDFARAVATEDDLTLDELAGARVSVVAHEIQFDPGRQLWFCDIEIDAGDSYYPFVRLALARYQPNSVKTDDADVKLSRIVLADFAQLAPDRTAAVSLDSADKRKVNVTVTGLTYTAPGGGTEVEVTVETRQEGVKGPLGWVPVPDGTVKLEAGRINDRQTAWTGAVTLPGEKPPQRFRLVVREYERFLVDGPPVRATAIRAIAPTARRLVYADVLRLA